ncbi:alpha/beta hydrolase [Streptomyces sp. NPDC008343]|uniref:alpha/beta hydrolase n=1 Tax=Streptomyces sp. NPDC008343 TaxID=3364828 RepID=UPI0036EC7F57
MPHRLDVELAAALPTLLHVDLADIPEAREQTARRLYASPLPSDPGVSVRDISIPGPDGQPDVSLRLFTPAEASEQPLPLLFDIHGGGYVLGSLDGTQGRDIRLCRQTGAMVAAVDYRLAPEHPYPAALEDCYAGLLWLSSHASALGVDPARIAVYGQSAGAGLAAALTLLARDRGGPSLCFQFLGTPALDDRLDTPSMRRFTNTPGWYRSNAIHSWNSYLGDGIPGTDSVPVYAAPARATDLSGLPPAYITAMELDPLRDEGIAYACALLDAGIPVELHVFPGTFHGSVGVSDAQVSRRELTEETTVLTRALHALVRTVSR